MKPHIKALLNKRNLIDEKLQKCRMKCPHTNADEIHKGRTGNYDPTSNKYWIEKTCLDCGKFWIEDIK